MSEKKSLGGVRVDEYMFNRFRDIANNKDITQATLFTYMFYNYLNGEKEKEREEAISLESEIKLISNDLENMLSHFKVMAEKAQNTIISTRTNAEQIEKNLRLDVDTKDKRIEELEKRNQELELFNTTYTQIKNNLTEQIDELTKENDRLEDTVKNYTSIIDERNKEIIDLKHSIERIEKISEKESKNYLITKEKLEEDIDIKNNKIKNLETSISSLADTIKNMNTLKESEIDSITAKFEMKTTELESIIDRFRNEEKEKTSSIKERIEMKCHAESMEMVADLKLQLANMKQKYIEVLTELNNYKSRK